MFTLKSETKLFTEMKNQKESPPLESHAPPQSSKRSRKGKPTPLSFKPVFPQEIIIEIFSNLPVGSLLRFRCLSKSLKSLIADPFFIKKHIEKTQNDPKFTKRVLLYACDTQNPISFKSCSLNAIYKYPSINSTEVAHPLKECYISDRIVGSCNGLICIYGQDTLFLLNPTLGVYKRLPDLGFKKKCRIVYGLGYDASVDDYKVVRVSTHQVKGTESFKGIVWVYSLRTNCWRRIQDFTSAFLSIHVGKYVDERIQKFAFGPPFNDDGKYVDGSLNWGALRRQGTVISWIIVSLDLAQETYKEVLQPCYGEGVSETGKLLGLLDGCLCVRCNYGDLYIDVWVMREYGKRESWTKLLTIPCLTGPEFAMLSRSRPVYISESDEILLHSGSKMILYNPKENSFRQTLLDKQHQKHH